MSPKRAARAKLSRRRRVAAPAARQTSPELPYPVLPPLPAEANGDSAVLSGGGAVSPAAEPVNGLSAASLAPSEEPDDSRQLDSTDDSEDESALALAGSAGTLRVGDVVVARYRGVEYPALLTRLERRKATVKFICDLVKFKKAFPIGMRRKSCRPFTYEEKVRCESAANSADPVVAETLRLSLEAVEELEASRASGEVDDPEEFLKTRCDYIVRLRGHSMSPQKAQVPSPAAAAVSALQFSPLKHKTRNSPTGTDADSGSDEEISVVSPSPPPPQPPPAPLPPHLLEEQRAYAARLLEVVESDKCDRHLRAVHAGRAPSWRRDAYRSGARRQLIASSCLGDLEAFGEMAERARRRALRVVEGLRRRRPECPRIYAEEVMAPEAVLFAVAALSDERRPPEELDSELALGARRFRSWELQKRGGGDE
ncbi:hypothetical protein FJT64_004110 [Amphibalanus amphitrite]|uniref:PWWP domain-containing protein n=1 Tax=Amphibalanus amphitrite TaxID=1232801 RepID=A0A6A4W432_AMPAM|nr:hypothetical protein FJT64_004110 [Amphibalanus amphitrite]